VTALASGDAWLKKGANILLFGPSGSGKLRVPADREHQFQSIVNTRSSRW
jgi:hypothetical protein